jgi:hypothetical protein
MCADHTKEATENSEALSPLSQALEELGCVNFLMNPILNVFQ